ncbi:MAG: hypothetical protein GX920_03880, partial [Micrococcus sp.]|nr:hypothetical protein [Micrococcus sp.]
MMRIVLVADTAILAPNFASTALNAAQAWIVESLGWFYMLLVGILAIALLLAGGLETLQAAALTTALPPERAVFSIGKQSRKTSGRTLAADIADAANEASASRTAVPAHHWAGVP